MKSIVSIFFVSALLFSGVVYAATNTNNNSTTATSVELGILETSPRGHEGGYAIPASGGSTPTPSLPDVVPSNPHVAFPDTSQPDRFRTGDTVTNIGNYFSFPSGSEFGVAGYLDYDDPYSKGENSLTEVLAVSDRTSGWYIFGGGLGSGASFFSGSHRIVADLSRTFRHTYCVDTNNWLTESNESNNCSPWQTYNPNPPTITLQGRNATQNTGYSTSDLTINPGEQVHLSWTSTDAEYCDCNSSNSSFNCFDGSGDAAQSANRSRTGTDETITEPAVGTTETYRVWCYQGSTQIYDEIAITTAAAPPGSPTVNIYNTTSVRSENTQNNVLLRDTETLTNIRFTSTNADTCTTYSTNSDFGDPGDPIATSYSDNTVSSPLADGPAYVYRVSCTNAVGTVSKEVRVSKIDLGTDINVFLSGNPEVVGSGGSSILTWSTINNPTSCTASGDWSGSKNVSGGSQGTGPLTSDRTYTITCQGTGGPVSKSVTIAVNSAPAVPSVNLTVSPNAIDNRGSATLNWVVSGATSCDASGNGNVAATGVWTGSKNATGGSQSTGILENTTNSTQTYSYTLTCRNAAHVVPATATLTVEPDSNLLVTSALIDTSAAVADPVTGEYDNVRVVTVIENDYSDIPAGTSISYDLILRDTASGTEQIITDTFTTGLNAGQAITRQGVFNGVFFGSYEAEVRVDLPAPGAVREFDDVTDNVFISSPVSLDQPPPIMSVTTTPKIIRQNEIATIDWDVTVGYPLTCTLLGQGINQTFDAQVTGTGSEDTPPLANESKYTLDCDGFIEEVIVKVLPEISET